MIKQQLFIGAALIVGVAVGYFVRPGSPKPSAATSGQTVAKTEIADHGNAASVSALRARIQELERRLAEQSQENAVAVSNAVAEARRRLPGPWGNPHERLEKLKNTDPERYVQVTNRMAKMRANRQARMHRRSEFLASVDTSWMSARAKANHTALQDLLARREELDERMHAEDLTEEQRRAMMDEMHSTDRELRKLNRGERSALLGEITKSLGFEGNDAEEINSAINEVIEATDDGHGMPPPPPPSEGGQMK